MRIITNEQISNLGIKPEECVEWVRGSFLSKYKCQLPPKISLHPQGNDFINTMPCILPPEMHTYGCKVVTRIKGQHPALSSNIMLFDTLSGKMTALIEADLITAMRTGAVAALAVNTLRNAEAKVFSFVGLGAMGHATLECLLATNKDTAMVIRLKRYKNHAEETIEKFTNRYPDVIFEVVESMDDLVDDADVVVSSITEADGLLVEDVNFFKPGVLVVPVHTRGFQNCDTVFDKVFADDEGHVKGFKYFSQFRQFSELSEVLNGSKPGRESDEERILSYNIGLAIHDAYFASNICKLIL